MRILAFDYRMRVELGRRNFKKAERMDKLYRRILVVVALMAAGCAAFTVAGQVQRGRQALLLNDPEAALAYFQQAAEKDPNYIYTSGNFRESIWTYVGRAQYA